MLGKEGGAVSRGLARRGATHQRTRQGSEGEGIKVRVVLMKLTREAAEKDLTPTARGKVYVAQIESCPNWPWGALGDLEKKAAKSLRVGGIWRRT